MIRRFHWQSLAGNVAIAIAITLTATAAGAQSTAPTSIMKACWVEGSGVIYRRDTTNAPMRCQQSTHREIEWTLGLIPTGNGSVIQVPLVLAGAAAGSPTVTIENTSTTGGAPTTSGAGLYVNNTNAGAALVVENKALEAGGIAIAAIGRGAAPVANFSNSGTGQAVRASSRSTLATMNVSNQAQTEGSAFAAQSRGTFHTGNFENFGTGGSVWAASTSPNNATGFFENRSETGGRAVSARGRGNLATADFRNTGSGSALFLENSAANVPTLNVNATGGGAAIFASSTNEPTLRLENTGTGENFALLGYSAGTFPTAQFENRSGRVALRTFGAAQVFGGSGTAMYVESSAPNEGALNVNAKGSGSAITANSSSAPTIFFDNTGTGENFGILGYASGTFPTAQFHHRNGGVALRTFGGVDVFGPLMVSGSALVNGNLQINGNYAATGTKNAVVSTSSGTREMYTEEATEVWFADYGQATLSDSVVWVPFDATFAETIEHDRPYHVFLQAYGDASIYVSRRTADGFEVRVRGDRESTEPVDFSYRLVAKRRGYGDRRLRAHPIGAVTLTDRNGAGK